MVEKQSHNNNGHSAIPVQHDPLILSPSIIRNVGVIAHVDHGKTTLLDTLRKVIGVSYSKTHALTLDSHALEQERGITITSKNVAVEWEGYRINFVDTPGHADFGGEVERILSMVDSVLLLVDAIDGPMPQTRFVTQKAFAHGLNPIVVVNKIDREGARPEWVVEQVFDLFDSLGASDQQLDFPIVYTSALRGYATLDFSKLTTNMVPLLRTIVKYVPAPPVMIAGPFQMQISTLDYSSYVGTIGIGRIHRGIAYPNMPIMIINRDHEIRSGRILQVLQYVGTDRKEVPKVGAGDIVAVTGIDNLKISDTLCDPKQVEALPKLTIDEPTVSMTFQVNTSPFSGKEGKWITSRNIRERLLDELKYNVALRVEGADDPDKFIVSGRGELHLSILIENMRREGYELAVSRPEVIMKQVNGEKQEPYEILAIDLPEEYQGTLIEKLGSRRGDLKNMHTDDKGRTRLDYIIPSRALIGLHTEFLTLTAGTGIMHHIFDHYGPMAKGEMPHRQNGVMIANQAGVSLSYALFNLQERGHLFIGPQTAVYEGMVVGIHARDNDLVVNVCRAKQLTNMRAAGSDENIILTPPIELSLEQALEFIAEDELVEVTPQSIRIRKKWLKEHERKKATRLG